MRPSAVHEPRAAKTTRWARICFAPMCTVMSLQGGRGEGRGMGAGRGVAQCSGRTARAARGRGQQESEDKRRARPRPTDRPEAGRVDELCHQGEQAGEVVRGAAALRLRHCRLPLQLDTPRL